MELFKFKPEGLVKMSKLTKVSVYPKAVETKCSDLFMGILRINLYYNH